MTEFSNEDLSGDDQMDRWLEVMDQDLVPTRMRAVDDGFPASARTLSWDGVQVSTMRYPSLRVERTATPVRRSDPEAYQVTLVLDGEGAICQAGREARFGAGGFAFLSTSRPFTGGGPATSAAAPSRCNSAGRCCPCPPAKSTNSPPSPSAGAAARAPRSPTG